MDEMEEKVKGRKDIKKPNLVLVEGNDDEHFFKQMANKTKTPETFQIMQYGSKDELRKYIETLKTTHGYERVASIGITRDKDNDPEPFQSVCDALKAHELPVPEKELCTTRKKPHVTVFILPGGNEEGALEDLCLKSVEDKPVMRCVDDYMKCIKKETGVLPSNLSKARLHAFLASMKEPGKPIGQAVQKNYIPSDHPAFEDARRFLELVVGKA